MAFNFGFSADEQRVHPIWYRITGRGRRIIETQGFLHMIPLALFIRFGLLFEQYGRVLI